MRSILIKKKKPIIFRIALCKDYIREGGDRRINQDTLGTIKLISILHRERSLFPFLVTHNFTLLINCNIVIIS